MHDDEKHHDGDKDDDGDSIGDGDDVDDGENGDEVTEMMTFPAAYRGNRQPTTKRVGYNRHL